MITPSFPRRTTVSELPTELYLETTNRCNLKCRTCPQYFGMQEDAADLTPRQVRVILEQFPTVRRVVLHGIGEPLLNPELPAIIGAVKEREAYALFNTNGLLLRPKLVDPILRSGLDELRVSVDSASPETYKLVRGVDGLGRILKNVRGLRDLKESLGLERPRVSLWITGMMSNVRELPELVRTAAEIGVYEVYLQRLVFSARGLALQEESLYGRAGEAEEAAVREASRLAVALGVTLRGSAETGGEGVLGASVAESYRACRRPWSLMYVTANGNILPCCIAPFTGVPYEGIVLGNVFEESVEEIWNGPRYQAWRRGMLAGSPPQACIGCGVGWSL